MAKGLFDGMLRSAANQFARDGGKVLSNVVYGDAHSTPIRRVGSRVAEDGSKTTIYDGDREEVTADEVRQYCIESGLKLKMSRTSVGQVIGVALLGIIPLFISSAFFALASFRRVYYFFADDAQYAKKALVAKKVQDRRYSRGYRIEGFTKGYEIVKVPPTFHERMLHLLIALLYAAIAAVLFYWSIFAFNYIEKDMAETKTEQVIQE